MVILKKKGFYISILSTFSLLSSRRLSTLKYSSHSVHGFIDSNVPDVHLVSMCDEPYVSQPCIATYANIPIGKQLSRLRDIHAALLSRT
jgi:hypothetical protein